MRFHARQVTLAMLLLLACGEGDRTPRNVVVIGVDTLRADHLGLYGYERDTSPRLDRFARDAVVFERCITPATRTTQAVASLLTGRYPVNTGVRTLLGDLEPGAPSLAGALRARGYRTISVVATGVLKGRLESGFDVVVGTGGEKLAESTTTAALEQLAASQGPTFLWVFYRDPHMAYEPPELVFDSEYRGPHREAIHYTVPRSDLILRNRLSPRTRQHVVALYDSEIRYTDREVGRLLDWLDANDPGALVVFTADHGEGLGERDFYYDHGPYLNQPAVHVPLLIRGLGVPPQRVKTPVSLVDVAPTLLAALGFDPAVLGADGVDLRRLVAAPDATRGVFSETGLPLFDAEVRAGILRDRTLEARKRALVSGRWKLVYVPRHDGTHYELYDLDADPGETENLWGERDVSDLRSRLDAWVARDLELSAGRSLDLEREAATPEELKRLRDLGYLDPEAPPPGS